MMNIPKLPIAPQPEVPELDMLPIKELPVAKKPTFLPKDERLVNKLGIPLEDLHQVMLQKQQTQKYLLPFSFQKQMPNPLASPTPTYRSTSCSSTSTLGSSASLTKEEIIRQCRAVVVDWMTQVGDSYSLCNLTIHLAVALFDRILSEMDISRGMLQLVATSCILIAAKSEELDEKVPTIGQLNYCTDKTYTNDLIKQMEALILNRVQWDINAVTPLSFLGIYLQETLFADELICDYPIGETFDRVNNDVYSFSEFFVDLCRQDFNFLEYPPSVIAASSIAVTRRMLKIGPIWSPALIKSTGYQLQDIGLCCDHIWRVFEANFVLPGSPRSLS